MKQPLNFVVSQNRWSFTTGRIKMILWRVCQMHGKSMCFYSVWNNKKFLVTQWTTQSQWTTNGGRLGGPIKVEWSVEVMCCAYLKIFAFVDTCNQSFDGKHLESWNRLCRWMFKSPSRFILCLIGWPGNLLFYTLFLVILPQSHYTGSIVLSNLSDDFIYYRSKMGVLELGYFPVYTMCRHPQKSRRSHIQSQVRQLGFMDTWASGGKGKWWQEILWLCNGFELNH